jgi:uncharacterized protein
MSELYSEAHRSFQHKQGSLSPHVPDERGRQPFPAWKRIDLFADTLSDRDRDKVIEAGGTIPVDAYPGEASPDGSTTVD